MKTACRNSIPPGEHLCRLGRHGNSASSSTPRNSSPQRGRPRWTTSSPDTARTRHGPSTPTPFSTTLGVDTLMSATAFPSPSLGKDRFLLDNASASGSVFGVKVGAMPRRGDRPRRHKPEIRFDGRPPRDPHPATPGHVVFYEPQAERFHGRHARFQRVDRPHGPARRRLLVDHAFDPRLSAPAGRRRGCTSIPVTVRDDHRPRNASTTPSSSRC